MVNCGFSYRLNTLTGKLRNIPAPSPDAAILLPANYPVDSDLVLLETARVSKGRRTRDISFDKQLNRITTTVANDGGNVFKVKRIDGNDRAVSLIKGSVYYTPDYSGLKAKVEDRKNKVFKNEQCAYLVIYRSDKFFGKINVDVNGEEIRIPYHSKYVIKIAKGENYTVTAGRNTIKIDAKPGNYYYLKVLPARKHAAITIMGDTQGELESSLLQRYIWNKE